MGSTSNLQVNGNNIGKALGFASRRLKVTVNLNFLVMIFVFVKL